MKKTIRHIIRLILIIIITIVFVIIDILFAIVHLLKFELTISFLKEMNERKYFKL
jgi:hypothetical protein